VAGGCSDCAGLGSGSSDGGASCWKAFVDEAIVPNCTPKLFPATNAGGA